MPKFLTKIEDSLPNDFTESYRVSELAPVERTFTHHPQRHNSMLYDAVADNLRDGKTVAFPLGIDRTNHPCGTSFTFEKHEFMVLLPEPMSDDTRVIICCTEFCSESLVHRAASFYANSFVSEYRRFGSGRKHEHD